ncbi:MULTISPECIES: helix-turn-helix domain-containing protein [unclassified Beijerinckia]|uniref:AraC family transcriptional regulator n=1 Tax=unclassified Beijerinckia TaxID=2638183 RepID=UPI000899AF6C|nr:MULTISPECIES: helix-turn-helix domain-containing protein [unclassified Beijerinckia]MDH7799874.1 AraC-like DNA-binding protein [Beijerinckia sp. GAS462]SED40660.1 transcriptional regulator, AraC family [Beijerinckia sp. 28-YEA-48]
MGSSTSPITVLRGSISGVEDLREAVKGGLLSVTQLQPGSLRGELIHASTEGLRISVGQFSRGIRVRGYLNQNAITLGMLLGAQADVWQWGKETRIGDVVTFQDGGEEDGCFLGPSAYMTITLSTDRLLRSVDHDKDFDRPSLWSTAGIHRTSDAVRALVRRRIETCRLVLDHYGAELSSSAGSLLEADLLNSYLTSMGEMAPYDEVCIEDRAMEIVRAAEDYLVSMDPSPVDIYQLCHALQISRRTLHRAFKSIMGMGPITYLRLHRLALVRCRLIDQHSSATTVTHIALDHGFWELGRFSQVYRRLFGELPSETLERVPNGNVTVWKPVRSGRVVGSAPISGYS